MHPSPERADVTMVAIGAYAAPKGKHAPAHRHAAWKITYYRTGRITSVIDGVEFWVVPGTVLVLRPEAAHAEFARTAYSNYYLLLDAPDDQPWPERCDGQTAQQLGGLLAGLLREEAAPDRESPAMITALVTAVDIALRRHHADDLSSPQEELVRGIESIFEERYPERVSIEDVAREAGVSGSSLRQHFATYRGLSPQAALQAIRVRHALDLLRTSDLTLSAVADRCGFHSASHLSRVIKSATGTAPGRFRSQSPSGNRS